MYLNILLFYNAIYNLLANPHLHLTLNDKRLTPIIVKKWNTKNE